MEDRAGGMGILTVDEVVFSHEVDNFLSFGCSKKDLPENPNQN